MPKHAYLSASASHRWLACPPSAKLCANIADQTSEYAQQGTDCHELCAYLVEKALGRAVTDPTENLTFYDDARELVRTGDYDTLELLYDDIPDTLSQLIRTAFIARPGYKFVVSDYSAIEARVLAHLAGESWRSKVFAEGKDIYCASASQMFGVPVEKHGINSHLRQKGKIAELALGYGGSVGALISMIFSLCY